MADLSQAHTLSSRGQVAAKQQFPAYAETLSNLYDADKNPEGYASLGLAENVSHLSLRGKD